MLLLNKITKIESNSQRAQHSTEMRARCFYWTKLQKLKAIHNLKEPMKELMEGAFTEQNYKNWKQFTTLVLWCAKVAWVLLLNKITKIESNSQRVFLCISESGGCFYWTKLQKLKAIHNLDVDKPTSNKGAFTEQNYKNWKQFTTLSLLTAFTALVLLLNKITKIESNSQRAPSASRR